MKARTPSRHGHHDHGPWNVLQGTLKALVVSIFLLAFVAQPFRIPSESMQPTLKVGDFVMVDKQAYAFGWITKLLPPETVKRGDMIVFHHPHDTEKHVVKRVVALPGDHLRMRDGHVLIDELPLAEPYANYVAATPDVFRDDFPALHNDDPEIDPAWWDELHRSVRDGELIVPPNSYFALGDNRNDSIDSRYWGFVPRSAIEGRPALVYFSLASEAGAHPSMWARLRRGLVHAHVPR